MATRYSCTWLLLCYLILIEDYCYGSCFQAPIKSEITAFGRHRLYCEYQLGGSKLQLLPGSSLYTADCHDCSCTSTGLQCCGFGHKAGVIEAQGCVEKTDGCQPVFVMANNHTLDCFTGKPIDFPTMMIHPDNEYSLEQSGKLKKPTPTSQFRVQKPESVSFNDLLLRLENTKLAPRRPMQSQIQDILSLLRPRAVSPYVQTVSMAKQVPVDMSPQQSMTFHTDTTAQDIGWLPWMFFMN